MSEKYILYFRIAYIYFEKNQYDIALDYLKKSISENSNYPYSYYLYGYILWKQLHFHEAKYYWLVACGLFDTHPDNSRDLYYSGLIQYLIFNNIESALQIFDRSYEPNIHNIEYLICYLNLLNDIRKKETDENFNVVNKYLDIKFRLGKLINTRLNKHYSNNEDKTEIYYYNALYQYILEEDELLEVAEEKLETSTNINDINPTKYYYALGIINLFLNRITKSVSYFNKIHTINSHDIMIFRYLGLSYKKAGLLEKARSEYEKIISKTDRYIQATIEWGETNLELADQGLVHLYNVSIVIFNNAIRLYSSNRKAFILSDIELSNLFYLRAYTRIKLYNLNKNYGLLREIRKDLGSCIDLNKNNIRAAELIKSVNNLNSGTIHYSLFEKIGSKSILVISWTVILISLFSFFDISKNYIRDDLGFYSEHLIFLIMLSMVFVIISIHLHDIIKLKLPGIELEKTYNADQSDEELIKAERIECDIGLRILRLPKRWGKFSKDFDTYFTDELINNSISSIIENN